jgi:hypothetical protein
MGGLAVPQPRSDRATSDFRNARTAMLGVSRHVGGPLRVARRRESMPARPPPSNKRHRLPRSDRTTRRGQSARAARGGVRAMRREIGDETRRHTTATVVFYACL